MLKRKSVGAVLVTATTLLVIGIVAGHRPAPKRLSTAPAETAPMLQTWEQRYGKDVVARARKSAEARGWKPTREVFTFGAPRPKTTGPIRTIQDYSYGGGSGWFSLWAWEDGDDLNTIEGTVEVGNNATGQRVLFNVQLYTPDGDMTQAEDWWYDVLYADEGTNTNVSVSGPRRAPGIVRAQADPNCHMPPNLLRELVMACQVANAGRAMRAALRGAGASVPGAMFACRRGNWQQRLACIADTAGSSLVTSIIDIFNDPASAGLEDCDSRRIKRDWCEENSGTCRAYPNREGC